MAKCSRHGADCPFAVEAQRTFDAWLEVEKRFSRGNATNREIHDAKVAYHQAREERLRQCEGIGLENPGAYEQAERAALQAGL